MPGKQMAIDADLNAGLITDEEARKRRAEISQEADFYGAMDGASKFVKGDAMAGDPHHRHQPASAASSSASSSWACRSREAGPALLAADRSATASSRADPGAADLGRHRHHRHALRGADADLGYDRRHPDPRPAQGAARRRRAWSCCFAPRPGPAEAPVPDHRRRSSSRSAGRCATSPPTRAQEGIDEARGHRRPPAQRAAARPARRRARRAARSTRSSWRSASAWCRWSTRRPAARCSPASRTVRRQIASELGMVIPPVRIRDDVGLGSHEYVMQASVARRLRAAA